MKKAALFVAILLVLGISAWAADKPLQVYSALVMNRFTVDPDLLNNGDFPRGYEDVLQKTLLARLLTEQIFPQVIEETPGVLTPGSNDILTLDGEVAAFAKGNRAARVAIGYGAGSAKMKLVVRLRDSSGREVLKLEQTGRYAGFGNLTGGSADQARNEAARKVVDGLVKKIKAAR
jgi:Domain of unknown function (DUF4410)